MAHLIEIKQSKTYKTRDKAIAAVEKKIAPDVYPNLRYFIHTHTDGRFFPVFIGAECITHGIHFHFNVIG